MGEPISLIEYIQILRKRIAILLVLPLITVLGSLLLSLLVLPPVYEASVTLMVGQRDLVKTYEEVARGRQILAGTIKLLNMGVQVDALKKQVKIEAIKDSEIIKIRVENSNPELAKNIANTIATLFIARVGTLNNAADVTVVEPAVRQEKPVRPKILLNFSITGVLSISVALALIFFLERLDDTVKTNQDVEQVLALPLLGSIPPFRKEQ
ncbi:MAG: Wzz/FepE/Etk N-terminal domain-containing protein [Clostridia bacterium]|nr:Wzz/FepE/Etk N-terminal domain-containing protein [Clostridia bacterium]